MASDIWYYVVLTVEAVLGVFGLRIYEEPPYALLDSPSETIEIRRYAPRLAAQVELNESGEAGRGQAFGLLFSYIAGANGGPGGSAAKIAMTVPVEVRRPAKIAMTTPVQTTETEGRVRMQFFLPAHYTSATAPAPNDPRVKIVTVPEQTIAALRFSGTGRDLDSKKQELIAALAASQWRPTGVPYGLFYDAPFTIPFFRRNEAAVEVAPK